MKKIFSEAEVELTLLSALDDILAESVFVDGSGLYDDGDNLDDYKDPAGD